MIGSELRKLFKRKLVWVVFLGILILIAVSQCYYRSGDFSGKGFEELQERMALFERHKGELTEERLEEYFRDYAEYAKGREAWLAKNGWSFAYMGQFLDEEGEIAGLDSIFPKVYFPIQFGEFENWTFFLDEMIKFIKYIPIFIAVAFASLFTYEGECGMQEILLCARRGRRDCVRAKVAGAFLVTNGLYLYALVLPGTVSWILFQGRGADTSIQMTPWMRQSQLEMNYGELFLHTIFLSFIVINAILVLTLMVSFLAKSPMVAMCITLGVLFMLRPDFMSVSLNNEIANQMTAMTPVNVIDTVNLAKQMPITVGGEKLQWLTVAEVGYSVAFVLGGSILFLVLSRRQRYDAS